jgi:hypothetical protein
MRLAEMTIPSLPLAPSLAARCQPCESKCDTCAMVMMTQILHLIGGSKSMLLSWRYTWSLLWDPFFLFFSQQLHRLIVIVSPLQRYQELSKQRLDRAILIFVQNFRRSYVGEQATHSSKVRRIKTLILLLSFVCFFACAQANLAKIGTNLDCCRWLLKFWKACASLPSPR